MESEKTGDARHAVLEVVIALETVVTRIIDYYWKYRVPKNDVAWSKGIDLPQKRLLALPVAVGGSWLFFKEDAGLALATIRDRNKIAHPGNLSAQRLTDPKF